MITITATMEARPAKRQELLQTLRELMDEMRLEHGFLDAHISIHGKQNHALTFIEEWETQDDVNAYMRSYYFSVLKGALKVLSSSAIIDLSNGRKGYERKTTISDDEAAISRRAKQMKAEGLIEQYERIAAGE